MKLKLETDYETDEIETFVFRSQRLDNGKIQRDPAPMDGTSVDSSASVVVLNSTVVCVIRLVKIWVIDKRYGLTIKLVRINVLPSEKKVGDCHDLDFAFFQNGLKEKHPYNNNLWKMNILTFKGICLSL